MPTVQGTYLLYGLPHKGWQRTVLHTVYKIQCYEKFINLYWGNWMPMSH